MKKYLILSLILSLINLLYSCTDKTSSTYKLVDGIIEFSEPKREQGQTDVLALQCDPIDTVRTAIIGVGLRGTDAVVRLCQIEGVIIKALCDLNPEKTIKGQEIIRKFNLPDADLYTGEKDWMKICERPDIDLIYVCTHWKLHTPIAVYAMNNGKHVAVEVPAALTVNECWQLVDTSEKTRKHCMMLENCCYDFFELATLNMAQHGIFGELMHVEGGYNHDLRSNNFNDKNGYWDMWRLRYNMAHTGNPYPTHGLGPVAHALNIHRGDKMDYLVSMSSDQKGMTLYAEKKFGMESDFAKQDYSLGDMNTTIIRTTKGKTIMIEHNVTSPRPYSRLHTLTGTKGFAQKYPIEGIALEPKPHEFFNAQAMDSLMKVYEHPFSREIGEKARQVGGHGGMDFIMDYRLIYCLRNGLPLDIDVYDAAEWSSLVELTETSVLNGSMPVKVPDFTRGAWNKLDKLTYAK
ncbi:MAG: Gfo/Idh/MocA family oxidoreductase [Paludibacter sp.]|nr:Gfo/Idh/MocA family oxidoreductase [Paludibacter sp.]MDD4427836.1 Gfo/Idh/MocA family oxidoreductase [Paludibacter sp.]